MVNSNEGIPNPFNSAEDTFQPHTHNILGTDSDTDQEETVPTGYEPLPTNGDINDENHSDQSDNDTEDSQGECDDIPCISTAESDLLKEVWSNSDPVMDISMDSQKVEEVKQAMLNVTLPATSIPAWANNIPEEQWKQHLISRLQDLQKSIDS